MKRRLSFKLSNKDDSDHPNGVSSQILDDHTIYEEYKEMDLHATEYVVDIPLVNSAPPIYANAVQEKVQSNSISKNQVQALNLQPELADFRTQEHQNFPSSRRLSKDSCYDPFRTYSRRFEKNYSNQNGNSMDRNEISEFEGGDGPEESPTAERYFAALEGPELETLKPSEKLLLPQDEKWPFLLRFTISSFGVSVGFAIQALLWKTIATSPAMSFLHISLTVNYVLWCISLSLMASAALIYSLKMIFYFEAVRREFLHPIRVNFFFVPSVGCILLVVGLPPLIAKNLHDALWYISMAPILCLELKIYGQWMMGGERRLSKVANPSTHLSIIGNFAGALLGSSMGLKEGAIFFFGVGLAHYIVLFVTLYQRLPTNETLPKDLHPVFFLFIAAPSLGCLSWAAIVGHFDVGSRIAYFLAMFLYASLVVRINFFRGLRFSLAWWAYTVPMTGAALATIRYAAEINNVFMKILSVALSCISAFTCIALVIFTIVHAFIFRTLFPNDIAIAIRSKKERVQ